MARKTLIGAGAENLQVKSRKQKKGTKSVSEASKARRGKKLDPIPYTLNPHVETIALERIQPAAYNPRRELTPGDAEFEKLRKSIERFGLVDPPIWNKRTGNLVGGHQRLAVLRHVHPDITELAVSVVDLDPAAEKALNVALNKIAGEWDETLLTDLLRDLMMDGDATVTGFDQAEIDALLEEAGTEARRHEGTVGEEGTDVLGHSYKVIAECTGAKQQAQAMKLLTAKGIACHTITRE